MIPLKAKIQRYDDNHQLFEAILILNFDKAGKIILWQEVYVEGL